MGFVRKHWLIVLLVVVVLLVLAAWVTSLIPHYVNDCTYQYETYVKECAPKHLLLFIRGKTFELIEHNDKIIAALSGIAVAAFTGTLWWSTRKLWRVTNETLRHAEKTAEWQLRAYVAMDSGCVMNSVPGAGAISAFVRFKNYGNTPAYDCKSWSSFSLKPANEATPFREQGQAGSRSILGPGATLDANCVLAITPAQMNAILRREMNIYFWGRFDYVDAFTQPRHFVFRCTMTGGGNNVAFVELRGEGWGLIPDPSGYEAN